ncbi:hypothetical protein KVV02_006901 [Mortierella alpina]|uniref:Uncharacterized protein n=1 Tax=Mortierella alpina TaxID=64518 RepID=A0A9P8A3D0_MORAP|nr:hypothetical protein KVV02_006901 [Mortierella alpina]
MLQQLVPRVSAEARLLLLLRGTSPFLGALPRRPAFFSTTARRCNPDMPPAERSGTAATAAAATTIAKSTAAASEAAGAESEPIPTNLDNPPEAVASTVSPPTTYAFLKPTPVVLLTGPFGGNWCFRETWQTSLADQGYQSTSIELAMPPQKLDSGDAYIRHFVKVLKTSIETDHSFYPPILIAHGLHALVAQKYVESNPVSALVLVSPFIPEIIKGRFQELSHKLQIKGSDPSPSSTAASASAEAISVTDPKVDGEQSSSATAASATAQATPSEQQPEYKFETHADVLAQEGFRETYVLPKKAVYKIDLVAKEIQEKEKAKEKEQKEKKEEKELEDEKEEKAQKEQREQKEHMSANGTPGDATEESTATTTSTTSTPETLGKDSVPVGESAADAQVTPEATVDQDTSAKQTMELKEQEEAFYPEQTVESEASIQSPLEQLPLAIYDSIPKSQFEPTFPILLVTSNADEIVSTADVKDHHFLAQEVDHIELEDRDDGGHLIMVSDNTEWEQGIQGITAWLDSNGM